MDENPPDKSRFVLHSILNVLGIFLFTQIVIGLLFANIMVFFPRLMPPRHTFVLDSAEFIEEIHYFGSGPEEIDDTYLKQQWYRSETSSG